MHVIAEKFGKTYPSAEGGMFGYHAISRFCGPVRQPFLSRLSAKQQAYSGRY